MISTTSTLVAMIKGLVFSIKVLTIKSKTRQKVNQDMKRVDDVARMSAVGHSENACKLGNLNTKKN